MTLRTQPHKRHHMLPGRAFYFITSPTIIPTAMGPNSVATGWLRIMTLLRTIYGWVSTVQYQYYSTSTAICPPLYYVLPWYTSCVETKKTRVLLLFLLGTRHSGHRWRDWRPVLDQILNYRLHVQKVWRSKSRHLSIQNQPKRNCR